MGVFLALGSLAAIIITAALGALSALKKEPVWKDWLLGTLAGFLLFFISLFIIPDPAATVSPPQTIAPPQQQTTSPPQTIVPPQQQTTSPSQPIVPSQPQTTGSAVYQ